MSGLVGIVRFNNRPVDEERLVAMATCQPFRSPTGPMLWHRGTVGLGALPTHGEDPSDPSATAAAGEVEVVADARLDNRDELLADLGLPQMTSDVDLIAAAYRAWGVDCPTRLLGDFAFGVWDAGRRRLLLARDAMGMRPLYYTASMGRIVFASEVEQILQAVPSAKLNVSALAGFLTGVMPSDGETYYQGISELPPGRSLTASPDGYVIRQYWQPDPNLDIRYADEWEYAEQLREILRDSVRCRLRTEDPVGILLSGGLDSGAAASTAALLLREGEVAPELRPYSWASPTLPEIDERDISGLIVGEFGLDATDVPVAGAWPLDGYPAHGPHRDEPMIGAYQALIERALALARDDGVRVMLSGDRGDLTMGGWTLDYVAILSDRRWRLLRDELRTHRKATGESMTAILTQYLVRPAWRRLRARGLARAVRRIGTPRSGAAPIEAPPWVTASLPDVESLPNAYPAATMPRWTQQRRFDEIFSMFQMRGMLWSERTCARQGLVFADPWSDRRIAEFALSIPQQILARPGESDKRLLRAAMAGVMPEPARLRARKTPPTPLFEAAMHGPGRAAASDLLRATRLEDLGLVDGAELRSGFEHYLNGEDAGGELWPAMSAEWWLRAHWPASTA